MNIISVPTAERKWKAREKMAEYVDIDNRVIVTDTRGISNAETGGRHMSKGLVIPKRKRKYFRKCGVCGERHEQSEMIRDYCSPNGWICLHCHIDKHTELYIDEEW